MTVELEYIKRRMDELGIRHYTLRIRHFVMQPGEKLELEAWQEFFFLTQGICDVQITSDFGMFDMSADNISEMQYEHQGLISMQNTSSAATVHVKFIQVIPLSNGN
ncbi:MAG: hypothetical protein EWV91_07035 [Microcystis aeruginosa Ma_QC_Ca_00000000_S207]|uniref:Uncharacterized protein n=1 Tax=Microcystis aeruginosa Ma_QC_Ca_00000000_S207 TaxID=2486251 RepID=A0A552FSV5_MICAE|nr:MAG: hypothetical protein EWV91_07035 [Microcystis aeruginosa Ma_QC_Ca_00000000_S207]